MFRFIMALACAALALALGACGKDDNKVASSPGNPSGTQTQSPTKTTKTTKTTGTTTTKKTTTTPIKPGTTRDVLRVSIKNIKFMPHDLVVRVGQKIRWANNDKVGHNVTATKGATFASDTLDTGDTFSYTPTKTGTINYVCTIHAGQDGKIIVRK
jgi:plastocyanin